MYKRIFYSILQFRNEVDKAIVVQFFVEPNFFNVVGHTGRKDIFLPCKIIPTRDRLLVEIQPFQPNIYIPIAAIKYPTALVYKI
jgi:hypothetical protein